MQKNKTHRIISISPSQQLSYKHNNNKTATPIKPFQQQTQNTRTNTIKTTARPEVSLVIDQTYKKSESKQDNIQSIYVSSYKNEGNQQNYDKHQFKKQAKIDDILNRIGRAYDDDLNNSASNQLLKKTEINQLRQVIRSSKYILRLKQQQSQDPLKNAHQTKISIQETSLSIKQELFRFFSNLHKQLYSKQKELYQELEEKIYCLNQKNITKCLQQSILKSLVYKCEIDVNKNYEQIIKNLEVTQLSQICKSYAQKIQFYMDAIKTEYKLKVQIPQVSTILNFLPSMRVTIQKQDENSNNIIENNCELGFGQWNGDQIISNQKKKSIVRQSLGRHIKNIKSNLEDLQNIPFGKIKMRDANNCKQAQPRVSSARGRY